MSELTLPTVGGDNNTWGTELNSWLTANKAFFNVKAFGAVGNGVADDTAEIQAAIDALPAAGGVVYIPAGTYLISSSISLVDQQNVFLVGEGGPASIYAGTPTSGTVLKWSGAGGGTVVQHGASSGAATTNKGGGLINLAIDGNSSAAKGLEILSQWAGQYRDLHIMHCTTVALDLNVQTSIIDGIEDTQHCRFDNISIRVTSSAIGIRLDGGKSASIGNASLNLFTQVHIIHVDGVGLQLIDADTNTFVHLMINRTGTGIGIELQGNAAGGGVGHARHNVFINTQPVGGITSRNATTPASDNLVIGYNKGNSVPEPTIESGSTLNSLSDRGALPNMVPLKGRNAAGSADISMLFINTLNEVQIDTALRLGSMTIGNTANVTFSTSTGSKIGTGATQKIGFWNATPVAQPSANADTSGATLPQLETEVNELKALLRSVGFMAP